MKYLGHIVSHEGIKVHPNKIKAMMEWIPEILKNLRGVLGLRGYSCNFIKNYGQITTPLIMLLKYEAYS